MDDWDVAASDEEWTVYNPPEAKKVDSLFIPDRLAGLFKKIKEDQVVTITSGYPRVGAKETSQTNNTTTTAAGATTTSNNNTAITPPPSQEERETAGATEGNDVPPEDKSFEAFNFDDTEGDKPSMKRKTPGSGKRGKKEKVGSMSNVMNDILRHKYLDELESSKDEAPPAAESKGT